MKNITTFICALALSTTFAFSNPTEDKAISTAKNALPVSVPAVETPAPQPVKATSNYNKLTPAQKAAIVELDLKKSSDK